MAPFVETWPERELEFRSQVSLQGNKRKGFDGNLKGCELLEMLQYKCEVEKPVTRESVTRCWPIERMFRRCVDRNGSFMVETTAWEGKKGG